MTISNLVLDRKSDLSKQRYTKNTRIENPMSSKMIYFQILMKILVDFIKLYQNWFKNLQFEFLFSIWSTLKIVIF
jgi:hypothetical protein